jgi:hypothetical protein
MSPGLVIVGWYADATETFSIRNGEVEYRDSSSVVGDTGNRSKVRRGYRFISQSWI